MFHFVDDLAELRRIFKDLIAMAGHTSMEFDSAESYLDYFNSESYQAPVAILTDYCMAGITGYQLIRKVRERLPFQKAAIISCTPAEELGPALDEMLCYSLTKPFRIEQLFTLLEALIGCHQHYKFGEGCYQPECCHNLNDSCPFYRLSLNSANLGSD